MISVATRQPDGDPREWDDYVTDMLARGFAVQGYVLSWRGLKEQMRERFPGADCWYTERNGDLIFCLVPQGTPAYELPDWAMEYIAFEWIDPDKDFGTGHAVDHPWLHLVTCSHWGLFDRRCDQT